MVRLARHACGWTQHQLGERIGYSAATISRLETGRQILHDIATLRLLSRELRIPPAWLGLSALPDGDTPTPKPPPVVEPPVRVGADEAGEDAVERRRFLTLASITGTALFAAEPADAATVIHRLEQVLTGPGLDSVPTVAAVDDLRRALTSAKTIFDACHYGHLSAGLPRIIAAAQHSADQTDGRCREQLLALLTDAYALASELAVKLNQDGMAWVAADRALSAAHRSGDAVAIAAAARSVAIAMRRQGRHDGAVDLLTRNALALDANNSDAREVYAAMLCTAAYTCAQHDQRARALDLIGEAEQAAARLPDTSQRGRLPTSANVAVYRIGIHTALGDAGAALDHARTVDHRRLPTPERRARYWIDTARAWEAYGRSDQAVHALRAAERAAPEEISRPSVAAFVSGMLYGSGSTPASLRALAVRNGIV
ncbi:helix-turn-helix domain-containing protein [Nonomuraea rhizosphaerae]|uniref:helix-turn-helix domain-containing protein n=1 Tax=Nonomuraea rhizosphaerae TaxID=2665663 RepID=UPI001C5F6F98|nr:helix-turn-helix transcriptional regulator [Nonomuraea rhizosphaerae]